MESSSESGSPTTSSEYATVWSSPPKRPAGRTKFHETRHPIYRGVRRRGSSDRWVCEVREPNKRSRIWLGTFRNAEMAARAHDVAAIALRGHAACLNFADSAWLINMPTSFSSVKELKCMAIDVAEALNGRANGETRSDTSSTSASQVSDETEVVSGASSFDEETPISDGFDWTKFDLDGNGEMNSALYYACLAEALLMEPPVGSYGSWEEDGDSTGVSLWSYSF
ncbi:Dehydration-responsive element-binding protein 1E [Rhynchospora pubera]|uniref:Dehydration-responsive element-binding protein 1E n=1 Tax=Rhynchospora pubera TaxID=906938 RepID=A0AAV8E943_9POAL|nr:Dehydration-responsive element-binding protein 1E [Rhynchospora pubera]